MSHERIESALELLLIGFEELQGEVEEAVLGRVVEDGETDPPPSEEQLQEMDEQYFGKVQSSVQKLSESGRCAPADLLAMISVIAEALEELSPELFEEDEEVESGE